MFISPRRCTACGESGGHAFDHAKEVSAAACDHSKHDPDASTVRFSLLELD